MWKAEQECIPKISLTKTRPHGTLCTDSMHLCTLEHVQDMLQRKPTVQFESHGHKYLERLIIRGVSLYPVS